MTGHVPTDLAARILTVLSQRLKLRGTVAPSDKVFRPEDHEYLNHVLEQLADRTSVNGKLPHR